MNNKNCTLSLKLILTMLAAVFLLPAISNASIAEEVFKKVSKSVYFVVGTVNNRPTHHGSAVAVTKGILASNCHVVLKGERMWLLTKEKKKYPLFTFYHDKKRDLCLMYTPHVVLKPVMLRRLNDVRIGEEVFAIGNPRGMRRSISRGIIANKIAKRDRFLILSDVSIAKGSSGGGLFDKQARLVGITTLAAIKYGSATIAIPADLIHKAIPRKAKIEPSAAAPGQAAVANGAPKKVKKFPTTRLGTYGRDQIGVYRYAGRCYLHAVGRGENGDAYASMIWSPKQAHIIYVYPSSRSFDDVAYNDQFYRGYPLKYSRSYLIMSGRKYQLYGQYDPNNQFHVTRVKFTTPITKKLINESKLTIELDEKGKRQMIEVGLRGFGEAYRALRSVCRAR